MKNINLSFELEEYNNGLRINEGLFNWAFESKKKVCTYLLFLARVINIILKLSIILHIIN